MTIPSLSRICVAQDGRIKANFDDNTIMLVNAGGSAFISCPMSATGSNPGLRQLSEYALSRHVNELSVVLEFRNMHVDQPFICKPLLRAAATRQGLSLGYQLAEVWWADNAREAVESGMVETFPDGRVSMAAVDGSARIVLHGHRRRFAVCYPLLVEDRPQDGKYDYVWQTQVFSLQGYPPRWHAAVQLLQAVVVLLDSQHAELGQQRQEKHEVPHDDISSIQGTGQLTVLGRQRPQRCSTALPTATDRGLGGVCDNFQPGSWWYEPTLTLFPTDEVITMEWQPEATYQFHPSSGEVEVWVHVDESCLASIKQGRFVTHLRAQSDTYSVTEQMYAAACVPEAVWLQPPSASPEQDTVATHAPARYPLGQLAAHALKLREQMAAAAARTAEKSAQLATASVEGGYRVPPELEASFGVTSEEVLEQATVQGQGTFTAYRDGRVRMLFDDRAILHMNTTHSHCKVFLPDGQYLIVATANPVGVEAYVQVAVDFSVWAFKPQEQREHEARLQAHIQAEAAASQRMALLLAFSSSHQKSTGSGDPHCQLASPLKLESSQMQLVAQQGVVGYDVRVREQDHTNCRADGFLAEEWDVASNECIQGKIDLLLQRNADLLQRL